MILKDSQLLVDFVREGGVTPFIPSNLLISMEEK